MPTQEPTETAADVLGDIDLHPGDLIRAIDAAESCDTMHDLLGSLRQVECELVLLLGRTRDIGKRAADLLRNRT